MLRIPTGSPSAPAPSCASGSRKWAPPAMRGKLKRAGWDNRFLLGRAAVNPHQHLA